MSRLEALSYAKLEPVSESLPVRTLCYFKPPARPTVVSGADPPASSNLWDLLRSAAVSRLRYEVPLAV